MTGKDTINKMAEKINKLELVKAVLYKHFARAIDKVVQQAIQNAAAELLTIIPPEYLEQLEETTRKKEQNAPRGAKIAVSKLNVNHKNVTLLLTSWIAEKKDVPEQLFVSEVIEITDKALHLKLKDQTSLWIPKSQIKSAYLDLEVEQ